MTNLRELDPVLRRVRSERGLASKIAAAIGLSRPAVWRWTRVPAEYVMAVESVTGVPRHKIRPDLYPITRERRDGTEG